MPLLDLGIEKRRVWNDVEDSFVDCIRFVARVLDHKFCCCRGDVIRRIGMSVVAHIINGPVVLPQTGIQITLLQQSGERSSCINGSHVCADAIRCSLSLSKNFSAH